MFEGWIASPMANLFSNALTTLARVKLRLNIPTLTTTWDTLIENLINGATAFIEGETGRSFKSATVTNELYSLDFGQTLVTLRRWPVASISTIEYRTGSVGSPTWVAVPANDYELIGDGKQGVLKIYNGIWGPNCLRVTYVAGYVIDFTTEANHLPQELSDLCERLAAARFKKRESEGKDQESAQEVSITWSKGLNDDDKALIRRYIRSAFV